MRIGILTLFPEMFAGPFSCALIGRAVQQGLVDIRVHHLRQFTHDRHHTVDDYPFGGGPGMVLKPEPIFEAVEALRELETYVILLSPQGRLFRQAVAQELAQQQHLLLICGRYEGVDERVREYLCHDELSVGDYVLSGGEAAALVVVEAVVRLLPGVLGSEESLREDSHTWGLLEYPHYTRPAQFRDWAVPSVLLSGNHALIARWRRQQALRRTFQRRPELLATAPLSQEERDFLRQLEQEQNQEQRPFYYEGE